MRRSACLATVVVSLVLTGCATSAKHAGDPFENYNRTMFKFNDKVDKVALKPVATAYRAVVPTFAQLAVGNFFSNLSDVWTGLNNFLQGKPADGASDFMRFAVNSTLGLGGLIDLSSLAGMPKHREDFGQTLGKWGVGAGPYIVLPLLGSSTIRDTAALPADFKGDLWSSSYPVNVRNVGSAVRLVDARAAVLDASDLIENAALDRYEFVRDAYLQRRQSRVYDGDPPDVEEESPAPGMYDDPEGYVPADSVPESEPEPPKEEAPAEKASRNDGQPDSSAIDDAASNTGMGTELDAQSHAQPDAETVVEKNRQTDTEVAVPLIVEDQQSVDSPNTVQQ